VSLRGSLVLLSCASCRLLYVHTQSAVQHIGSRMSVQLTSRVSLSLTHTSHLSLTLTHSLPPSLTHPSSLTLTHTFHSHSHPLTRSLLLHPTHSLTIKHTHTRARTLRPHSRHAAAEKRFCLVRPSCSLAERRFIRVATDVLGRARCNYRWTTLCTHTMRAPGARGAMLPMWCVILPPPQPPPQQPQPSQPQPQPQPPLPL
jgi:hypothetical protein